MPEYIASTRTCCDRGSNICNAYSVDDNLRLHQRRDACCMHENHAALDRDRTAAPKAVCPLKLS